MAGADGTFRAKALGAALGGWAIRADLRFFFWCATSAPEAVGVDADAPAFGVSAPGRAFFALQGVVARSRVRAAAEV